MTASDPAELVGRATPPAHAAATRLSKRLAADTLAKGVVSLGGWLILAAVSAILLVIVIEVLPLFRPAEGSLIQEVPAGENTESARMVVIDEYQQSAAVLAEDGSWKPVRLGGNPQQREGGSSFGERGRITSVSQPLANGSMAAGLSDGAFVVLRPSFPIEYVEGQRILAPELARSEPRSLSLGSVNGALQPVRAIAYAASERSELVAGVVGREVIVHWTAITKALMGPGKREERIFSVPLPRRARASAVAIVDGRWILVGTRQGELLSFDARNPAAIEFLGEVRAAESRITSLGIVLGEQTIVVGSADGAVSSWQLVRNNRTGQFDFSQMHQFERHQGAVTLFSASKRNKSFATGTRQGEIFLHHATTGKTDLRFNPNEHRDGDSVSDLRIAPKGNGIIRLWRSGKIDRFRVRNPHPEISLRTLFGKVQYEGYAQPVYVWQSTGANDAFEPKLSLVPLIVGTLKGTLYALLFAVPIAVLSAFYASQFMNSRLKAVIKPTVELMAALPSVVIGFIAGLWLAPALDPVLPGIVLFPPVALGIITIVWYCYRLFRNRFDLRSAAGFEVLLLVPVVIGSLWCSLYLGSAIEELLLGGDYRHWVYHNLGIASDQRNAIVAGIAVGFAVVPIIFTLAEDALSSVPRHLTAGSLALGATLWQTASRVVFPVAIPGIFSAVIMGVGRAVGETMIVLMATGNTPLLDWGPFRGFRALSANIAVELPEAPHGGTLYRVLFLTALILFAMTFVLNTISELVKAHFRRKFKYL